MHVHVVLSISHIPTESILSFEGAVLLQHNKGGKCQGGQASHCSEYVTLLHKYLKVSDDWPAGALLNILKHFFQGFSEPLLAEMMK